MKLTESKLKQLILETINENQKHVDKIFRMLEQAWYTGDEAMYNQAVSLTVGANLVNEVLERVDRAMYAREFYGGPTGGGPEFDDYIVKRRDQFYEDVGAEVGLSAGQK